MHDSTTLRRALAIVVVGLHVAAATAACGGTQRRIERQVSPATPRAYAAYLSAELAWAEGDVVAAREALEEAVRYDESAPYLWLRLAQVQAAEGEFERAHDSVDAARRHDAAPWKVAIVRAEVFARQGRVEEALRTYEEAAYEEAPTELYEQWVRIATRFGQAHARLDAASKYREHFPERASAHRAFGEAAAALDQHVAAAEAFEVAATLPDGKAFDAEHAATSWEAEGRIDDALAAALRCAEQYREHLECYVHAVDYARRLDDGAAPLERAIVRLARMTAGSARLFQWAASSLIERGAHEAAAAFAQEAARQRPRNVDLLHTAAFTLSRLGSEVAAVEMMQRALTVDPDDTMALNFIGYTWAERGERLDEAEVYIHEALAQRPDDPNILDSLAWVYFRQERFEEALDVQLRAVELGAPSAVLYDHLGDIYTALGRRAEAIEAYERALELAQRGDEDVLETVPEKLRRLREGGAS